MALAEITPEMRQEYLRRAAEARQKAKDYAIEHLRNDFPDKNHWRKLASHYGITMPSWYNRTTRVIRRAMKVLGYDGSWVKDNTGHISLKELMEANPSWPSYAFVGLLLESAHARDNFAEIEGLDEELPDEDEIDEDDDLIDDVDDDDEQ